MKFGRLYLITKQYKTTESYNIYSRLHHFPRNQMSELKILLLTHYIYHCHTNFFFFFCFICHTILTLQIRYISPAAALMQTFQRFNFFPKAHKKSLINPADEDCVARIFLDLTFRVLCLHCHLLVIILVLQKQTEVKILNIYMDDIFLLIQHAACSILYTKTSVFISLNS